MEEKEVKMTKNGRHILYLNDDRIDLKTLSRREILNCPRGGIRKCVVGSMSDFGCYITHYRASVIGDRIFWSKITEEKLIFKGGKFYGSLCGDPLACVLDVFKLNWITNNPWTRRLLASNKTLWAMVFKGKITNPEDLAKKFSKLYFKGKYSYKALKLYFSKDRHIGSLWDIYYYTTNPSLYIEMDHKITNQDYYSHNSTLLFDTLHYCKIENTKLNPAWSIKRLQAEHQAQIEREHLKEIESMPNELIAPTFSKDGLSLLLDERSTYIEGCVMHNCVHSCYWRRIKSGEYLIASGVVDGTKIDLGISVCVYSDPQLGPIPHFGLSQVHSIYNGYVSDDIRRKCINWITDNTESLMHTVWEIKNRQTVNTKSSDYRPLHDINALEELRRRLRREEDIDLPF